MTMTTLTAIRVIVTIMIYYDNGDDVIMMMYIHNSVSDNMSDSFGFYNLKPN